MKDKKLAVFFPGIGYTVDKPLMYYSRKLAAEQGYEIKLLPYQGFPQKVLADGERMRESFRIAMQQTEQMLSGTDLKAQIVHSFLIPVNLGQMFDAKHARTPFFHVWIIFRYCTTKTGHSQALGMNGRFLG